jgi:hypothetical protein
MSLQDKIAQAEKDIASLQENLRELKNQKKLKYRNLPRGMEWGDVFETQSGLLIMIANFAHNCHGVTRVGNTFQTKISKVNLSSQYAGYRRESDGMSKSFSSIHELANYIRNETPWRYVGKFSNLFTMNDLGD